MTVLRLIGYWDGPMAPGGWPDVRDFVRPGGHSDDRGAMVRYLRSGSDVVVAAGFSACRVCGVRNGSAELTDGTNFVWPEGLAHYVESHDVRLPDDVVAVARRGPAPPVDPAAFERAVFDTRETTIDDTWWRDVAAAARCGPAPAACTARTGGRAAAGTSPSASPPA